MKAVIITIAMVLTCAAPAALGNSNSIMQDDIEYYVQTDKPVYDLGEDVEMLYRITNLGVEDVTFTLPGSPEWNFWVRKDGEIIWSAVNGWWMDLTHFTLGPGESKQFPTENPPYVWDMRDSEDDLVTIGEYDLIGGLDGSSSLGSHGYAYTEVAVPITIVPEPTSVYYVDGINGDDDNDGLTKETAFATIQNGIDTATDGDTVIVLPALYEENIDFLGKDIVLSSTNPNDPNVVADTIIDGGQNGRVVTFNNGEDPNCALHGFTITNGYVVGLDGGGIYCWQSSPTITNCIITGNSAWSKPFWQGWQGGSGGGMCNWYDSSPTISNCIFKGNSADYGGGIANLDSDPAITNCTFSENWARTAGGMDNSAGSAPTVTNCLFSGNSAQFGGGGMANGYDSNPMVINCVFSENLVYAEGNSNPVKGGAVLNYKSSSTLINCVFTGNSTKDFGGAIFNLDDCKAMLANCTFAGNSAGSGNAVACDSRVPWALPSNIEMTNCILRDGGDEVWNNDSSTIVISYSNVQGAWSGDGNIDADPLFVDPAYEDYHLAIDSPCINAGDPNYAADPNETDLDGKPRIIAGRIDMGAYEAIPIEAKLRMLPRVINQRSRMRHITALVRLPADIRRDDIDSDRLLTLYPGQIEAEWQYVLPRRGRDSCAMRVLAFFDKAEFIAAVPENRRVQVDVVGRLKAGQFFYGTDEIRITDTSSVHAHPLKVKRG